MFAPGAIIRRNRAVGEASQLDPATGKAMASWIKAISSEGVVITDNETGSGAWVQSTSLATVERNTTEPPMPVGDVSAGQAWFDRVVLGKVPPDPRDVEIAALKAERAEMVTDLAIAEDRLAKALAKIAAAQAALA